MVGSETQKGAMTAEIAVLNKHGVALAADSAVTLRKQNTQKIYNSANKLFMLSKYHPVGVMVYGNASLMGIPWETIIKFYREELGSENCNKLVGFAEHFFNFLGQSKALFPSDLQERELLAMCHWLLMQVKEGIDETIKDHIDRRGPISDDEVRSYVNGVVQTTLSNWDRWRRLDCFPANFEAEVLEEYSAALNDLMNTIFGELPIEEARQMLLDICACRCTRAWWSHNSGGIVFAGFGKDDIFPSVQSYTVEHVINNRLRLDKDKSLSNDMNETGAVAIMPYAQPDMVHRFIKGIDPEYDRAILQETKKTFGTNCIERISEAMKGILSDEQLVSLRAEINRIGSEEFQNLTKSISTLERQKFIDPVLDTVGDLQKDDLAAMAESLVNLTSFKLKITDEAQTVGGPIDVAVISKGDGFIWIKRKHYFSKDLNPTFFANYFRRQK
jgi:hypothetical protein